MRRGGAATGSASLKRRPKARSTSCSVAAATVVSGSESRTPAAAAATEQHGVHHHLHNQSFVESHRPEVVASAAHDTATMLQPPPTRFRDMDLLLDMLANDQQQQRTKLESSGSIIPVSATAVSTTTIVNQCSGGSVSQDTYSDLLAMSPTNSVEEDGAYIAETLAIHLASMPSRSAAREAARQYQQQQQQQIILQQRPTSVIVASSNFGSSLPAADFSGGSAKSTATVDSGREVRKVSAEEAEGIISLVSLPVLGDNGKPELYRAITNNSSGSGFHGLLPQTGLSTSAAAASKKMTSSSSSGALSSMINAPTANLFFNRPKPVTDTLFSFNNSSSSAATNTTTTLAGGIGGSVGSSTELLLEGVPSNATKTSAAPAAVVRSSEVAPGPSGRIFSYPSGKEFSMEEDTLLRELFGDLADSGTELEKLSPYIGDVCVILKEPTSGGNGGSGQPSGSTPAAVTATTVVPMDIQVIDFGPAGSGFDDIEIPIFSVGGGCGGGNSSDYKVKSEPGLEVDFKDFPELLIAPLTPSQETPLLQDDDNDEESEVFRRRSKAPAAIVGGQQQPPVKCEVDRGSPDSGMFWTQLQVVVPCY